MSANFAYDQLPPEWDMVNEQPEADEGEFFPSPDAETLGRPSAEALSGAAVGLYMALRECRKLAAATVTRTEAEHWMRRARQCAEVLEWLDRGAP